MKLASSAQDLAARKVTQELNVEMVPCSARQGDKVGCSIEGEPTQSKVIFIERRLPEGSEIIVLLRDIVKHFESNPSSRNNYDSVL